MKEGELRHVTLTLFVHLKSVTLHLPAILSVNLEVPQETKSKYPTSKLQLIKFWQS